MQGETLIFGYGSLLWRPAFSHGSSAPGYVEGWARRFWQGSTDHRGTPAAPGRVVTLVPAPRERVWGRVYAVCSAEAPAVLAQLDAREQDGYARLEVPVVRRGAVAALALTYVAAPTNPRWLGDAPLEQLAAQIAAARGPSGTNREYVERLALALRELGEVDPHVERLLSALAATEQAPR